MRLSGVAIASSAVAHAPAFVRVLSPGLFLIAILVPALPLSAQYQPPSERLTIQAMSSA